MTETSLQADGSQWTLSGNLDFDSVPKLLGESASLFKADGEEAIHVDLAAVSQVNSGGVALLLQWLRDAKAAKREIHYQNAPEQLRALAKFGGVADILSLQ